MAHDTLAYVPAGFRPVASNGVAQGAPSDGANNKLVLFNRRQQWWWQSGPVDMCCLCFSVEAGIVMMAGLEVARNCFVFMWFGFAMAMWKAARNELVKSLAMLQEEYDNSCTGDSPAKPENDCVELEARVDFAQNALSSVEHTRTLVYVYEYLVFIGLVVGLTGGLAGLWAVCVRSTWAAKLFLWSWLAGIAFSIAASFARGQIKDNFDIPVGFVYIAVYYVFVIYLTKVVWSYYAVLKARGINTSPGNSSGVELRGIMDDERSGAFA